MKIRLNERQLWEIINKSCKKVLAEWNEPSDQINSQWNDEINLFFDGLRRGNCFVDNNTAYVEIFKNPRGENNDHRYVYIRKGDNRLHDDHFMMQNSPVLTEKQLKDIYYALGWQDELQNLVDYNGFEPY